MLSCPVFSVVNFPRTDGGKTICGLHIPKPAWVALVVSMGGMLEWYDFAVFGFVAKEIGDSFFPSDERKFTSVFAI